jgi:hypothetical protein
MYLSSVNVMGATFLIIVNSYDNTYFDKVCESIPIQFLREENKNGYYTGFGRRLR